MRKTYCIAKLELIDVLALADSTVGTSFNQSVGNTDLFAEKTASGDYATLERNMFVLDGSKEPMEDDPDDIAFLSKEKSGIGRTFSDNPIVSVAFTEQHTSAGLTLFFGTDYPSEIIIRWYSLQGSKLEEVTFYPTSTEFICRKQVSNYGAVEIEFVKTRLPHSYARLQYIKYGMSADWKKDEIKTASVVEEVDVTGGTLSVNTAEVELIDQASDFDVGNMDGLWKSVQKTQEVELVESINGEDVAMGTYYVDTWSFGDNRARFSLVDAIGLMDKYTFYGGLWVNAEAGPIFDAIFEAAHIKKYAISDEIRATLVSGHLGIMPCREALQMLCFACGAIADTSRSDSVSVRKPDRYVKQTIPIERKFYGNMAVELDDYVSGVSIECQRYSLKSESEELFNDVLPTGVSHIEFSTPIKTDTVSVVGGEVVEVHVNYIDVLMTSEANCTITGTAYESHSFKYKQTVPLLEAGETESVVEYGPCTLYNPSLLKAQAEYLLGYHALRKKVDVRYLLEKEHSGEWANIESLKTMSTTLIESQNIDLTGGFVAQAMCRGYSIAVIANYYTGTELYAGGGSLL